MTADFRVVIPARLASSRLPGKVLLDLAGKSVLQHVYERAQESGARDIVVATDDEQIKSAAESFGAQVCMTRSDHESGTSRLEEVAGTLGWHDDDIIVNLQGDEPFMPAALIQNAATCLATDPKADIATVATPIEDPAEWQNPNAVKVVCDAKQRALYFSRASIPYDRSQDGGLANNALRHIGLYVYRVAGLKTYCALPPCELESIEALEQLRALHGGMSIQVLITDSAPPPGIDTQADLDHAIQFLKG